jgi:hypothetical protein
MFRRPSSETFVLFVLLGWHGNMTAVASERTVLPPARPESLAGWVAALGSLRGETAALVAPNGARLVLPPEVFEVLRQVVFAMSQGLAITVASQHTVLTTSEAAHLLGVSRPTRRRTGRDGSRR